LAVGLVVGSRVVDAVAVVHFGGGYIKWCVCGRVVVLRCEVSKNGLKRGRRMEGRDGFIQRVLVKEVIDFFHLTMNLYMIEGIRFNFSLLNLMTTDICSISFTT
jgi:hypothetical protein